MRLGINSKAAGCVKMTIWLTLLFILTVPIAFGGMSRNEDGQPDSKKRSCIQIVDAYAYLSENMTLGETRAAAFAQAKRLAVEKTRTYIQSKTTIEDFVLKKDQINGSAQGAVTILEQKDLGVENNTRYHVWIKAEVEFGLKPGNGKQIADSAESHAGPLTVKVWTPKKSYHEGELVEIFMRGNRSFFARIVNLTSSGDIIQLLPNDYRQSHFFEAGRLYQIPGRLDRFELRVSAPFGRDQIVVYASEAPLGDVSGMQKIGSGLSGYGGNRQSLGIKSRGLSINATSSMAKTGVEFYEATWKFETLP